MADVVVNGGEHGIVGPLQPAAPEAPVSDYRGSSVSVLSSSSASKLTKSAIMFSSTNGRRQSKGYRDGVGTKLSIIDIRQQLNDQLKCLEIKLDTEVSIVTELQEFFKRRAEVEMEYSRNLDKLVKNMIARHRAEKQKQEQWATMSTYACWKNLLAITRKESQDHQVMAEIYNNQMVSRLAEVIENSQRIFRKCREIGSLSHEDMMKVLNELQSAMKTYHQYQNESKQAELKLRNVESQKVKVEQQLSGKNTSSRKLKGLERQFEKKQQKYADNKLKALKARNDYLLCIDAANAAINKYFSDDISDLMDCMDFGYHNSVGRAMMMYLGVHEHQRNAHGKFVDSLNTCITDLDSRADKQKFMELNNVYFMLPKKFEFQPFKGDEVCQISAQKEVQEDLIQRHITIEDRLNSLKVENDEIWKTLETTEKTLVEAIQVGDYEINKFFADEAAPPKSPHEHSKLRSDRLETESYYLEKFRDYTLSCNRLARLQSKHTAIQRALGENQASGSSRPPVPPPKPKKRRIGHHPRVGQPKLFGGSLEEYIEATGQEIPLIIKSCIRVINLYGLHHQGVFRVSGAQVEINQFKSTFESGEDALADVIDASEINSVAGVLKLYFRELREPLFPLHLFDALVECTREKEMAKRVERIKDLLSTVNRAIFVVMRYLFAFLNHLTEYSDENMMDPYNLAICFGPTLLPIPPDRDQVTFQASVNEIIKIIIVHQEEIFPNDGGEIYEKMILDRFFWIGHSRDSVDAVDDEDEETSSIPSDEEESVYEPDVIEATALFDFDARSPRELSFKRGDVLVLYNQVSQDWWEGCFHGKEGLIPDKYITVKHGEDNKSHHSHEDDKNQMSTSMILPSRPARQISDDSGLDASDKSLSQPNVSIIRETDILTDDPELSPPPLPKDPFVSTKAVDSGAKKDLLKDTPAGSSSSTSVSSTELTTVIETLEKDKRSRLSPATSPSTMMMKSAIINTSLMSTSLINLGSKSVDKDTSFKNIDSRGDLSHDSTTDDFSVDIDSALEEVMAGLKSLEMQQKQDKRMSLPAVKVKQTPKHTPDLVIDLPDGDNSGSSTDTHPDSPTISAAETFAQSNQGTLKKAGNPQMGRQDPVSRLSISSEPGDLLRAREQREGPMMTFSITGLNRSTPPPKSQLSDSVSVTSPLSTSTPHTSPAPPSFAPPGGTPSPAAPPPVAQKPKPQVKAKPPVMKKPPSRPEMSHSPPVQLPPP
ncbi:SLIT-ROBO Rho GTPase-activating protein 1-like isoform X3 [Biomphalaria glabrata]|uniref:SLIT-ROBO Rho GTPase-activating protein 1-like isoform X3 n=1 Tax=Biomphalaria glabrata TaxID=6526 RepID=A0A9U8EDP1_BIOGL|nr:SLIT-ROBO Rho GTPase-activating protein 1-like isoform X3 [Biomphalaria glabrata]